MLLPLFKHVLLPCLLEELLINPEATLKCPLEAISLCALSTQHLQSP